MSPLRIDASVRAPLTRREWLRRSGALLAGGATMGSLAGLAGAATGAGYKALVCIELAGGNDGLNTITPIDAARYAQYAGTRGPLALARDKLIALNTDYGLHPALAALVPYWQNGKLAAMFNVGPLHQPLTQAQYLSLPEGSPEIPGNLFSHSDQMNLWETASSDPLTRIGWGGGASAILGTANPVISVGGNATFGAETVRTPLVVPVAGAIFGATGLMSGDLGDPANRLRRTAMDALNAQAQNVDLADACTAVHRDAFVVAERIGALVASVPGDSLSSPEIDSAFASLFVDGLPSTSTAAQLYQIAKLINGRTTVQGNWQVFYARQGGYDMHSGQVDPTDTTKGLHAGLLAELGNALAAFQQAMDNLGMSERVVAFTQADFGRTFAPNSSTGTDHAWGNHHFILGGPVNGGATYGAYPELVLGGPDDLSDDPDNSQGRWIPTTSVDQYARTLLNWFGLTDKQLHEVLPNLVNFPGKRVKFI